MGARPSSFTQVVAVVTTPPIAWKDSDQQVAIYDWFEGGEGNLVVVARAGCLAGNTTISINRAGKGWTLPLIEMCAKWNGQPWPGSRGWDPAIPTYVQQERDSVVRLGLVKQVWASGIKKTFTVRTTTGRVIRATSEHQFRTSDGWYRLDQLTSDTLLHVRGTQTKSSNASKSTYSDESGMWNHPYARVRPADKTHPQGTARVSTHRLVVEAAQNGFEFQEFLWRLRNGQTDTLTFLDPAVWAVHHRDRNTQHNTPDNLEVLTHEEHCGRHGHEDVAQNVLFSVAYEQVQSVIAFGEEPTFDIEVAYEPHNFLANGIVVHNSGKTTTIIRGVRRAPESNILLTAFNKRIADELNTRLADVPSAVAKTLHSVGYAAIRNMWRGMPVAQGSKRADWLTEQVVPYGTPLPIRRMVTNLHSKGREMVPLDPSTEQLTGLALFFDYTPDETWTQYSLEWVVARALDAMTLAAKKEPTHNIGIDFADMVFLPLAWTLLSPEFDMVVVDEGQDMNHAQLLIAQRVCSGRMCIVGDDKQAIYAFRGADTRSLSRLRKELDAEQLPLTVTYRCGQAIVREAQQLVPDIEAGPTNAQGTVEMVDYNYLLKHAAPGDFVLSRLNAPLVSLTLRFLREGKRARMVGRDIGAGILAVLKRIKCDERTPLETVLQRLNEWESKTVAKYAAYGQTALIDRCRDQAEMIQALAESSDTTSDMMNRIAWLFVEVKEEDQISCSSIHKAKGLESNRVFLLRESLYRRGDNDDERACHYVGITRAKQTLSLVTGVPSFNR